jgi:hypothetical protein
VTWTKLSDDFSDECHSLSDAAFRSHIEGLIWTMRRETDGYITPHDVKRFAESPHAQMAVDELVACGWWEIDGQGYRIRHHMEHQPEPDLIARRREQTAERQKRFRRKKAGLESPGPLNAASRPDPTRPVPGNASSDASSNGVTAWMEPVREASA